MSGTRGGEGGGLGGAGSVIRGTTFRSCGIGRRGFLRSRKSFVHGRVGPETSEMP
jgi:hypothetical protein